MQWCTDNEKLIKASDSVDRKEWKSFVYYKLPRNNFCYTTLPFDPLLYAEWKILHKENHKNRGCYNLGKTSGHTKDNIYYKEWTQVSSQSLYSRKL